ncbi:DUF4349 domain-containing protein [Leptospira kanakyensis]|uniref:DUF4349 domain-containing protein n=1 Tax=Leptospira kanakyensis TaxID=2484968 RepID=A0A6N4PZB7_9LEPT|nr:DUF4349 domain-containing protein [Leptospira kanakyensis]MCW7469545.1 DUF4349 domain-containing protein [Leptospira kanakyensis]TGK50715.1 DUF4349 domain-containing protein [Leptospira kanakyensis]TGK63684.1 DUF4349 domain-containing protein [Leptospira kanakyensis]TGK69852.1 DUF4349 domain-containing protein [Leptospira kanakyensis]
MKNHLKIIFLVLFVFFLNCGKESNEESVAPLESAKMSSDMAMEKKVAPSAPRAEGISEPEPTPNQLGQVFVPIQNTTERLLEYQVQLNYQTPDLIKTRKDLLSFITKYGFIESSSAVNMDSPYMNLRVHIRSEKLYDALIELDTYGVLLSEDISTVDHTEGMAWQKIKSNREKLRLVRRTNANNQTSANSKNWEAIEEAITDSENNLDNSEHEIWKIKDKVKWATLSINFTTPIPADRIQVPVYKNAFIGILNLFLELTYYFIWILPLVIVLGILYLPLKKIYKRFKK